jgi:bifunctional non-homologous end joining protein LigD
LWYDGYDLTRLPLLARKRLLRGVFAFGERMRFSDHIETDGVEAFHAACERGLEGLVAKRVDAPYRPGRSRDWLKCKCVQDQEFVIVGWTDPQGAREVIGALLVGYHEGPDLRFAGKVGTGFSERLLRELRGRLTLLEQPDPPVSPSKGLPRKGVQWVRPELVAQVGFSEWTGDGKLRHPRYLGLRDDKRPDEVIRERGTAPRTADEVQH